MIHLICWLHLEKTMAPFLNIMTLDLAQASAITVSNYALERVDLLMNI